MTIDEEIKHQEEISDRYARMSEYEGNNGNDGIAKDCAQCAADHRQLAEWLTELKEAKRLLKAAVEDLEKLDSEANFSCNCCKGEKAESCQLIKCWTWRYADEAMKLIGGETDEKP